MGHSHIAASSRNLYLTSTTLPSAVFFASLERLRLQAWTRVRDLPRQRERGHSGLLVLDPLGLQTQGPLGLLGTGGLTMGSSFIYVRRWWSVLVCPLRWLGYPHLSRSLGTIHSRSSRRSITTMLPLSGNLRL